MSRRIRLRQEDSVEYGNTVGCSECEPIQLESNVRRGHNEECRARMEEDLSKTDRGKETMGRIKDQMDEKVALMPRGDASHPADDDKQAETLGREEIRANGGSGSDEHRKVAKRTRDLDTFGRDIKGN